MVYYSYLVPQTLSPGPSLRCQM